jgi:hypothetical protein
VYVVWQCGLLRLVEEQARYQAFSSCSPSDHAVD